MDSAAPGSRQRRGRRLHLRRKPVQLPGRQYIVDALFLGVWGPLGELLDSVGLAVTSADLWDRTRNVITEYADTHPGQAARLAATGFLGTEFGRYASTATACAWATPTWTPGRRCRRPGRCQIPCVGSSGAGDFLKMSK